jgi:hypothetical protein
MKTKLGGFNKSSKHKTITQTLGYRKCAIQGVDVGL